MAPPNFPGSLDALANPTPTTLRNAPGFSLSGQVSTLNDIIEAIEAKLGIGSSVPGATAAVLRRTAAGASAWGAIATGDLAAGAVTQTGLATATAGQSTTATANVDILGTRIDLTTTGGDALEILMLSIYSGTVGTVVYAGFALDGGAVAGEQPVVLAAANAQTMLCTMTRYTAPAAGAHAFRPVWHVVSNSVTLTQGFHLVVELKK